MNCAPSRELREFGLPTRAPLTRPRHDEVCSIRRPPPKLARASVTVSGAPTIPV